MQTITLDVTPHAIAVITLNRPDRHNAFNEVLIDELTHTLVDLDGDARVRAILLKGEGPSFCAGADLAWMQKMAGYSFEENLADAKQLARLMAVLDGVSKPTLARVHGNVFGGGVGLVAACDIAIAAQDAVFALSEVKLGLIPAVISPYVVDAIGPRAARRYFLTGERFAASEAYRIGLVDDIVPTVELDQAINAMLGQLLSASTHAQHEAKALIRAVYNRPLSKEVIDDTAERIARVRASEEGREGVAAFLEKRKPAWVVAISDTPAPAEKAARKPARKPRRRKPKAKE